MKRDRVAFIGGGNMASALIGGWLKSGGEAAQVVVVEPSQEQRDKLREAYAVQAQAAAGESLAEARMVVWAVKPQAFAEAAAPCAPHVRRALQLSVMAGIRCAAIQRATGARRIVRCMPNTPALIGRGIAGLYARPEVGVDERQAVQALLAPTGTTLWVEHESDLDAVTALSGSGPAYVFYFIEAMVQAGCEMGLPEAQARRLAEATFDGAAALSAASPLKPAELRAQVTSKGGTTHAAITSMEAAGVGAAFVEALHAARRRAEELGG
jgi:pyrroline-5-carboxylate reductase